VRKGLTCEKVDGQVVFNTADVLEWREAQAVERVSSGVTPSANIDAARHRKLIAEAELAEIELAKARGALIPISDATRILSSTLTAVRAKLLAIPTKLAARIAIETSEAACRALVAEAVNEALDELVADAADVPGGDDGGGAPADPGPDGEAAHADGERVGGLLSQAFL